MIQTCFAMTEKQHLTFKVFAQFSINQTAEGTNVCYLHISTSPDIVSHM